MKNKLFAAALAALTLVSVGAASAQDYRRGPPGGDSRWDRGRAEITVRQNGRTLEFDRGDRMFYRLLDRPYHFRAGMTYSYTDRCNRQGCVVFVFDGRSRRPVDRIFAPHVQDRRYAWRQARGFDGGYNRFGRYDRDERNWSNDDDRLYREGRDGRGDDGRADRDDSDRDGRNRDGDNRGERDRDGRDGRRGDGLEGGPARPR